MNKELLRNRFDAAIRFLFYLLIFWLPYSPAVIEICVIASFLLWLVKRIILIDFKALRNRPMKSRAVDLLVAFKPKTSVLNRPIAYFILFVSLSVFASAFWEHALHFLFTKTLEWFIIYFLVIEVFTKRKHIRWALGIFLFSAFAVCADSLIQFYITHKDIFSGRSIARGGATAAFKHPNSLAGYLTFVVPLTLSAAFVLHKKKIIRNFFITFCVLALWSTLISLSRASWIGIISGMLFFFYLIKRKFFLRLIQAIIVFVTCLYLFLPLNLKQSLRVDLQNFETTTQWRRDLWLRTLEMIKDKPAFGHGLNIFMDLFQDYRKKTVSGNDYNPSYAHNCYLQITAETGIFGLLCFLWIIQTIFSKSLALIRRTDNEEPFKMIILGLLAGALSFLIHSFFDTDLYSLQLSTLFWLMIGILSVSYILLNQSLNCGKRVG